MKFRTFKNQKPNKGNSALLIHTCMRQPLPTSTYLCCIWQVVATILTPKMLTLNPEVGTTDHYENQTKPSYFCYHPLFKLSTPLHVVPLQFPSSNTHMLH